MFYVLIIMFSGSLLGFQVLMFSGFWSCFFPCHLLVHSSHLFSVPQLHLITNHLLTVFSVQVQSHSLRNPPFTLYVHATFVRLGFASR